MEPADDDPSPAAVDGAAPTGMRGFIAIASNRAKAGKSWANRTFDRYRNRPLVDFGMRLYERDRESAGSVVSSAIAFRLFLFFVPLLLFVVGIAGFFAGHVTGKDINKAGVTGNLASQIDTALTQPNSTRWIAVAFGLFGMITTGRTLSRALTQASCLAWRLPIRAKAPIRVIGAIIGLLVGIGLVSTGVNRIRQDLGVAVAGMSFIVALLAYTVVFVVLAALLPRATPDLGALLPGAALVGVTLVGLQAVSQLYLPDKFSRASQLYGAIGVTIVTLGWFFIAGRVIVLALAVDAVVYERFGSITQLIFGVPVLRILPHRSAWFRRRFGLGEFAVVPPEPDEPDPVEPAAPDPTEPVFAPPERATPPPR